MQVRIYRDQQIYASQVVDEVRHVLQDSWRKALHVEKENGETVILLPEEYDFFSVWQEEVKAMRVTFYDYENSEPTTYEGVVDVLLHSTGNVTVTFAEEAGVEEAVHFDRETFGFVGISTG